jgi:hypothetical protein
VLGVVHDTLSAYLVLIHEEVRAGMCVDMRANHSSCSVAQDGTRLQKLQMFSESATYYSKDDQAPSWPRHDPIAIGERERQ